MNKINFETGTQVSPAKVTIDNVDHEVTPAVWEGNTPLSPFVLNKIQDNIEKDINSTKEEIEKKIKNQRLKLVGKREQATRSGKNAVKELYGRGTHYITFEVDVNKITSSIIFSGILSIDINTASIYIQTSDGNFNIGALTAIANQKFSQSISISNENLNSIKNSTYTPRIQIYSSITDFTDMVYEEMMLRNSNTTDEYEPYGVMPSPEFPSDIRNVGDNINIFDKNNANVLNAYINGDMITSANSNRLIYIKVKENKTYSIKKHKGLGVLRIATSTNIPKIGDIVNNTQNFSSLEATYTIPNGEKYLIVFLYRDADANGEFTLQDMLNNFKIEEGSIATSYTPYNCGSIDYKVENADKTESKNIHFPLSEGQVLHKGDYLANDGIHQVRKKINIDISKFTRSVTTNGLLVLSSSSIGVTWDYKNISGVCSHFINANNENITVNSAAENILLDGQYNFRAGSTKDRIYFKNSLFTTMEDWEKFFNDNEVLLEYELTEEIVTPLTKEQIEAYYELQKAKYVDKMTLTCLNEIEPTLIDIDKKLEESLLDVEKLLAILNLNS